MLLEALYHPPHIEIDHEKSQDGVPYICSIISKENPW